VTRPDVVGSPHTAFLKWSASSEDSFATAGGGIGGGSGSAAKACAELSVVAMRETHVMVLPRPICSTS
jgi:hypothetical protein